MMNIENLVSAVCKGEEISIHKTGVGKVRENCVYAKNLKEVRISCWKMELLKLMMMVPLAKLGEHLSP